MKTNAFVVAIIMAFAFGCGWQEAYADFTIAGPGIVSWNEGHDACGMPACSASFMTGHTVAFTATAIPGAQFVRWDGECSGASATCVLKMDRLKRFKAVFTKL